MRALWRGCTGAQGVLFGLMALLFAQLVLDGLMRGTSIGENFVVALVFTAVCAVVCALLVWNTRPSQSHTENPDWHDEQTEWYVGVQILCAVFACVLFLMVILQVW